jgi:hypothetical protein
MTLAAASAAAVQDYCCLLDEQPDYLIPAGAYRPDTTGDLIVNPQAWFSWHGPMPARLSAQLGSREQITRGHYVVWVPNPATGGAWPYWVGNEYLGHLAKLVPGSKASDALPPALRWVLTKADILVSPDHVHRRRWEWRYWKSIASQEFRHGYATVRQLVPQLHLGALRRYFRRQVRTGRLRLGDDQVSRRYAAYNESVARFVQHQLTHAVSDVLARRVKTTYAYVAVYQSGSILERHTDREQCEYTITLCLDATPEPIGPCSWPINLDTPRGTVRVFQELGDGLLFRGRTISHHRDCLPAGHSATSLLFHYVDQDYKGGLD